MRKDGCNAGVDKLCLKEPNVNILELCAGLEFPKTIVKCHHNLGGLKYQKFTLSQFWRPKVQNQGVGKTVPSKFS